MFLALLQIAAALSAFAQQPIPSPDSRTQLMIVGVTHFVSARDLNNTTKFDPLSPE